MAEITAQKEPCGSISIIRVRNPQAASNPASDTVVVVLPTPPFWFGDQTVIASSAGFGPGYVVVGGRTRSRAPVNNDVPAVRSSPFHPGVLGDRPVLAETDRGHAPGLDAGAREKCDTGSARRRPVQFDGNADVEIRTLSVCPSTWIWVGRR